MSIKRTCAISSRSFGFSPSVTELEVSLFAQTPLHHSRNAKYPCQSKIPDSGRMAQSFCHGRAQNELVCRGRESAEEWVNTRKYLLDVILCSDASLNRNGRDSFAR